MEELTSRQKQAIATKLRISEAAMKSLKTTSYDLVKVTDICKAANVSVGTFYRYFESKDMMIKSCYNSIDLLIVEDYEKKRFASNIDAIIGLNNSEASIVESLGHNFITNSYIPVLMDESQYTVSPSRLVHLKLMELLKLAFSEHEIIDTDIYELSEFINRTARGNIFDWCLKRGTTSLVDVWTSDIKKIMTAYKNKTN